MSINFPSNPTTGDIFVFNQKKWRWNGYAWDRTPNADLDDQTGILFGGGLTANPGGSTFSVAAGIGQIVGITTNQYGAFPTLTEITWGNFTGITLNYLATSDFTRVYIDENGDLQQQTAPFGHEDPQTKIIIGTLAHIDQATISLVTNKQHTAYNQFHRVFELFDTFGPIKKQGMVVSANGANLSLDVSAGEALLIGLNYVTNYDEPDLYDYPAQSPSVIARIYRDGSGDFIYDTNSFAFYTGVDGSKYDDDSGTLQTVNNNQWTIQRLFVFPHLSNVVMSYYGRVVYNSYEDALSGIQDEVFTESTITSDNAIFLGYLVLRGGAADLTDPADAHIIQSGFCRVSGGGGGGGGAGAAGPTGPTGPTGADGAAGDSIGFTAGNTAPVGSETGDFWYENDTGLYYAYVWDGATLGWLQISGQDGLDGATGSTGPQGDQGPTGPQGYSIGFTAGNTAPVGSGTGDFWLETDTGLYYANVWDGATLGWLQISGPRGATGATGEVFIHVTAGTPVSANENDFWFETDTGSFYAYIDEGAGLNWVEVSADPAIAVTSVNGRTGDVITPDYYKMDIPLGRETLSIPTGMVTHAVKQVPEGMELVEAAIYGPAGIANGTTFGVDIKKTTTLNAAAATISSGATTLLNLSLYGTKAVPAWYAAGIVSSPGPTADSNEWIICTVTTNSANLQKATVFLKWTPT